MARFTGMISSYSSDRALGCGVTLDRDDGTSLRLPLHSDLSPTEATRMVGHRVEIETCQPHHCGFVYVVSIRAASPSPTPAGA